VPVAPPVAGNASRGASAGATRERSVTRPPLSAPLGSPPGLPPPPGAPAPPRKPSLPSLDLPVPAQPEFSVHEAMTPVRNVLELNEILTAAVGPQTAAGRGARPTLPGASPAPRQASTAEFEPIFRQYIELRRFYADTSEAMTFGRFVERLLHERARLLRQGHPAVRFDVLREDNGRIAVKVIGISR